MNRPRALPVVLVAAPPGHEIIPFLNERQYSTVQVHTGAMLLDWALDAKPDIIVLSAQLPDITPIEACRIVQSDLRIGHHIPTLILTPEEPTPGQRVEALTAGVWDFIPFPGEPEALSLKLQAYAQAKRNLDVALSEGLMHPGTGLHSRMGLARRVRELGALMARSHGALTCLVFNVETDEGDNVLPRVVAHAVRASDAVGALNPHVFAIVAPGTDQSGAVQLARRLCEVLLTWFGADPMGAGARIRAGYEAVANLKYSPVDPVELLTRATAAVRDGVPEPGVPWLRRHDATHEVSPERAVRVTPAGGVPA
jgi:PleD family two-component response regulator